MIAPTPFHSIRPLTGYNASLRLLLTNEVTPHGAFMDEHLKKMGAVWK